MNVRGIFLRFNIFPQSEKVIGDSPCDESKMDQVFGTEDLVFLITSYLSPRNNPVQLCRICIVSKSWNRVFSLARAQARWDYIMKHIVKDEGNGWLYHKIVYEPQTVCDASTNPRIPLEGAIRIYRSRIKETCHEAMKENSARYPGNNLPDHYYRAHREMPMCIELVPPRPLFWIEHSRTINFVNEIQWDKRPRLVNKFWAQIAKNDNGSNFKSSDGEEAREEDEIRQDLGFHEIVSIENEIKQDLGFHEIVSVRDNVYASLHPRPSLGQHGENTTSALVSKDAEASDSPRWVKLAHVAGEDCCRMFVRKHLLPMMGTRPTGNDWKHGKYPIDDMVS